MDFPETWDAANYLFGRRNCGNGSSGDLYRDIAGARHMDREKSHEHPAYAMDAGGKREWWIRNISPGPLVHLDPKTHVILWAFSEPVVQGAKKSTGMQNFQAAMDKIIGDIKRLPPQLQPQAPENKSGCRKELKTASFHKRRGSAKECRGAALDEGRFGGYTLLEA